MFKSQIFDATTENYDAFIMKVSSTSQSLANGTINSSVNNLPTASTPIQKSLYTIPSGSQFDKETLKQLKNGYRKRQFELNIGGFESKFRGIVIDARLLKLFILFTIIIITYKMVIVTMPYARTENLFEISSFAQQKYHETLKWANENDVYSTLYPLLCGLAVAFFSFVLVYLDSNVPGVSPPSPFSPKSKLHFRQQRSSSMHLGYITALAAGLVVSSLMYCDFENLF